MMFISTINKDYPSVSVLPTALSTTAAIISPPPARVCIFGSAPNHNAENSLRIGIAKAGETGTLLTNLAKVFSIRGEEARADATLWQSIQADPNQDNGLMWWATLEQDRGGEASYLAALRKAAALPGSWRAQLWLARHYLEHQDVEAARALYVEVLSAGVFDSSALMMISGDLGNNDQIPLIVELIAPIYDEHKHEPMAGLNLLRAYQALGNAEEGEKLLNRLYALNFPPIKQHLDQFAQAFQQMNSQAADTQPIHPTDSCRPGPTRRYTST